MLKYPILAKPTHQRNTKLMEVANYTHQFLIAMPSLADPNFSETVTYVCAHNSEGAMGIVINRPMEIHLGEVLSQLDLPSIDPSINEANVFAGGPVHRDRGFVIHRPYRAWESTIEVNDEIGVSTSRDILVAIAAGEGPNEMLVALGYAGWGAGQLENEMAQNAWLSGPADVEIIFRAAVDERWKLAAAKLGIDINTLSQDVGHA